MKWIVTGAEGMLGRDVVRVLRSAGEDVRPLARAQLDVTDADAVRSAVLGHDVVLNAAAWTAVDAAEDHEDEARRVNADGPRLLAREARRCGAVLVQVSTDYVFDGSASTPYGETTATGPRSAYGRTKLLGEQAVHEEHPEGHLVVRTAWLYGAYGPCFPTTMVRLVQERGGVDVVTDQVGQPTWTVDVADLVLRLVLAGAAPGTVHATSTGQTSWFDFARAVVSSAGFDPALVRPTTSDAFVRPAPRPAYSVLGHDALSARGVVPIGPWQDRWRQAASLVLA